MKAFKGWIRGGARWLGLAAAFLVSGLAPHPASAGQAGGSADLAQGPAGTGSDASGRIRFRHRPRGDRVRVRLRDLEPRTLYDIRDAATKSTLATVRTNRRGRAKASFLSQSLPDGTAVGLAGLPIEVCEAGTDDAVLEGRVPDDGGEDYGRPSWDEFTYRFGIVETDPGAEVYASVTLSSVGGGGLETPIDSISLFVGPDWAWPADGADSPPSIPGPVTFWIEDGDGDLREVASVEAYDREDPGIYGSGNDASAGGAGVARLVLSDDDGRGDQFPSSFYSWYADNTTEEGLPFGTGTVEALVGRSFEVRDGDGNVLLSGDLPALEEIVFEPPPQDDSTYRIGSVGTGPDAGVQVSVAMTSWTDGSSGETWDTISLFVGPQWVWIQGEDSGGDAPAGVPGPVSFWIADDEGVLQLVASVEAWDWETMPLLRWGMDGGGCPRSDPGGNDGDGTWPEPPAFYAWYADSATGLPLDAASVEDLSGRAFEVRDGDGNVLLSGTLPGLEEIDLNVVPDDPGTWDGMMDGFGGMMEDAAGVHGTIR